MGLFRDLEQDERICDVDQALNITKRRVADLEVRCTKLEEANASLRIFIQALVDLTWDKLDVAEDQFQARIRELKEEKKREGAEAAAHTKKPKKVSFACPNCGQPVAMTSRVCFYCGKPAEPPKDVNEGASAQPDQQP